MTVEAATHIKDLNSALPDGLDDRSEGDNHIRLVKAMLLSDLPMTGRLMRTQIKTGTYNVVTDDLLSVLKVTAPNVTIGTAVAPSVYGNGFAIIIAATAGTVTFTPSSGLVNGVASLVIPNNVSALISCDGSNFIAMLGASVSAGIGAAITGNTNLAATDLKQTRTVTAQADIVLPVSTNIAPGETVALKSLTYARVRVTPPGTETLDGQLATNIFYLPAFEYAEFKLVTTGQWIISTKPTCYIGELKEVKHGAAFTVPQGWLVEDGSVYDNVQYGGLFAYLGTLYNRGDELAGTFRVDDSRGRAVVAAGAGSLVYRFTPASISLTANTIAVPAQAARWPVGLPIRFNLLSGIAPVTVPAGVLVDSAIVYVVPSTSGFIQLASSLTNAQNGTVLDFTGAGTGTFTLTHVLNNYAVGDSGGEETHAISSAETLQHNHGGAVSSTGIPVIQTSGISGTVVNGITLGSFNPGVVTTGGVHTHTISSVGGNTAMNITNPYTVARRMIKA